MSMRMMKMLDGSVVRALAMTVVTLAVGAAVGEDICDLSLNPEARDGHTPPDPARFTIFCASKRYEANPTSVMLPDDKTLLSFWDIQAGGPCGSAAISTDAGRTWTRIDERIPKEFAECHDEPKAHLFIDPKTGKRRIRVFASYGTALWWSWRGPASRPLAEAMPSILSEDDGKTWKYLPPLGTNFACVVGFTGMLRLNDGSYLGVFSRGSKPNGQGGPYHVMGSVSRDGGLTWEQPFTIIEGKGGKLYFQPTIFRSPDGKELCCLAGSLNRHDPASTVCFSTDEGKTWTAPRTAPGGLNGFGHSVVTVPDGRYFIALRRGSAVWGWLGEYAQLKKRDGQGGTAKVCHSYGEQFNCGAPNVHVRKDGEILAVAASQINLLNPMPVVFSMRFVAEEIDREIKARREARRNFANWKPFDGTKFKPLCKAKLYGPFAQEIFMTDKKERKIRPFDGSKNYINTAAGAKYTEVSNPNGTIEIENYRNRRPGNAAIVVWTVSVPEDCKARLRLIGSPTARCCLGTSCVLAGVCATIFDARTAEISLKKGENDLAVMVYVPQHREACEAGFGNLPMRLAAGLDCENFKCVAPPVKLEIKEEIELDDVMETEF